LFIVSKVPIAQFQGYPDSNQDDLKQDIIPRLETPDHAVFYYNILVNSEPENNQRNNHYTLPPGRA